MASSAPLIAVVDDESSVRTMLGRLLRLADYHVTAFAFSAEFLDSIAAGRGHASAVSCPHSRDTALAIESR